MATQAVRPEVTAEIGPVLLVPAHDVDHPAVTIYANPGTGTTGWTTSFVANGSGATGASIFLSAGGSTPPRIGLQTTGGTTPVNPLPSVRAERTITGLLPGRVYSFGAKAAPVNTAGRVRIALGTAVTGWNPATTESALAGTFVATGTSAVLSLQVEDNPSSSGASAGIAGYFDEITITQDAWTEHVPDEYGAVDLETSDGEVTIDDGWTPYIQARLTVPITDPDLVENIDPRGSQRVTLTARETVAGESRTFDLGLRERRVDHKNGTIEVGLASDEALLIDRCNVSSSVDTTPRAHETSLRAVVNWALGKIGATLEPGTDDANLTAYWSARNLILDPGTAATPAGGYSTGNCTLDPNDASWSISGDGDCFNLHTPTNADSYLAVGTTAGVRFPGLTEGTTYVFSATGNVKTAFSGSNLANDTADAGGTGNLSRVRALVVHTRSGAGSYAIWHSPQVPNTVNTPTRVSVAFTVPYGATEVFLRAYLGNTAGQIRWDGFTLVERGPGTLAEDAVYFDGDTADTDHYVYAWSGTPDASNSTRTAVIERLPSVFGWTPGQSLWDFLQPLLEWSGLRLFCDEQRRWFLVDPATHKVPGYVVVQAQHNATEGTDTITRNDDSWADAVVCVYRWEDEDGLAHQAYDVAGDPAGKCVTRVYDDTPFPGPGAAAYILGRLQGKGRTQNVTALSQMTATPSQSLTVTLPGTLSQTGTVSRVTFHLKTGLMDIGSRGLTDTYPGSWWAWTPADQTWSEVDPGTTWDEA